MGGSVLLVIKLSDIIPFTCLSLVSLFRTHGASLPRLSAVSRLDINSQWKNFYPCVWAEYCRAWNSRLFKRRGEERERACTSRKSIDVDQAGHTWLLYWKFLCPKITVRHIANSSVRTSVIMLLSLWCRWEFLKLLFKRNGRSLYLAR